MSIFASEPNDTLATAYNTNLTGTGIFNANGYIGDEDNPPGILNDSTDVDFFKVDLKASNRLIVDSSPLYESSTPLSESDVRLFDASGNKLAGDGWWGVGYGHLEYTIPSDGTYYVGVSNIYPWGWYDPNTEGSGGEWSGQLGDYTLTISSNSNQPPSASDDSLGVLPGTTPLTISTWQLSGNDYDPDGDSYQISKVFLNKEDELNALSVSLDTDGNVVFIPKPGLSNQSATFHYTLTDQWGNISNEAKMTVDFGALLVGTNKSDRLFGTDRPDRIEGGSGNDSLVGLAGDDLIFGGRGRDTINGGSGIDRIVGGADADTLIVGTYEDTVVIERYDDSLLQAPDILKAFNGGTINIDAPWQDRSAWIGRDNVPAAKSLREKDVKQALEILDPYNQDRFLGQGAAFFTCQNRSFLAIDDGTLVNGHRTFSATSDSILEVSGDFSSAYIF